MANVVFFRAALDNALTQASQDWERDVRPLLPQFVPWEDVIRQVQPVLYGLA